MGVAPQGILSGKRDDSTRTTYRSCLTAAKHRKGLGKIADPPLPEHWRSTRSTTRSALRVPKLNAISGVRFDPEEGKMALPRCGVTPNLTLLIMRNVSDVEIPNDLLDNQAFRS